MFPHKLGGAFSPRRSRGALGGLRGGRGFLASFGPASRAGAAPLPRAVLVVACSIRAPFRPTPDRGNFVVTIRHLTADRRRYPTGSTMFCFAALRLLALPSLEKQKRRNPRLQTGGREVSGLEGTMPYSQILCPKTQAFGRQRRKCYTCRGDVFDNDHRASKTHPPGSTVIGCSRDLETFCSQLWEPVDIEFESGLGTFSAPRHPNCLPGEAIFGRHPLIQSLRAFRRALF